MLNDVSGSKNSAFSMALDVLKKELSVQLLVGTIVFAFVSQFFLSAEYTPLSLNTLLKYLCDITYLTGFFLLLRDCKKAGIKLASIYLFIILQFCYLAYRSIGLLILMLKLNAMDLAGVMFAFGLIVNLLPFVIAGLLIFSGNKYFKKGGVLFLFKSLVVIISNYSIPFIQVWLIGKGLDIPSGEMSALYNTLAAVFSIITSPLIAFSFLWIGLGVYGPVKSGR